MGAYLAKEIPPPLPVPLYENNWRDFDFTSPSKCDMMKKLRNLKTKNPEVQRLRILVHGPVGAGKSCFINSIDSICKGRMAQGAQAEKASDKSFTKTLYTQKMRDGETDNFLSFVMSDIMGLEKTTTAGAHVDDIIMVLMGHLKDGHQFNPEGPTKAPTNDNDCPTLNDKVHCLVSVLPADKISIMDTPPENYLKDYPDVIQKLREIRKKASALRIPQVIVMTMVDKACPEVHKDLRNIYKSKRIKEKMTECSNKVGVPMNYIFPVKNYNEEIKLKDDMDVLLLSALENILNFANDHVAEHVVE